MPEKPLSALREQVGDVRRTVEGLRVEAGKVEEFARALRDNDPVHRREAAATEQGFDGVPAPLTFTRTAVFPRYRPPGVEGTHGFDLGFREEYSVHGEQSYEFERPLLVGTVLSGVTTLVDVYEREGRRGGTMTFAVYETEFRDRDDELVVTARSTTIETGGAIDDEGDVDGENADNGEGERSNSDDGAGGGPPTPPNVQGTTETIDNGQHRPDVDNVAVGDAGPTLTVPDVQRKDFVKYAGASGDFTRIHYDEPYVRATGHESVFAQGMLIAGYAARMVTGWFGLEAITWFETQFRSQLFPGDSVLVTGDVTDVRRHDEEAAIVAAFEAATQDGTMLLTGEAEATIPSS
jgi:acyl dehydratase